mgnify:CR=1 FL=1
MGSKSGYPVLRGTSRPGVMKAWRGKEGFKEAQKIEKKIPSKKLKLPKKKSDLETVALASGAGILGEKIFGSSTESKKLREKIKKLTTKEAVGTGNIGSVRNRRASGGLAQRGLGKAFMKGGKV